MVLDKRDLRILELLSINCRFSIKNIAKAVGLSKDAIRNRISNLIKNEYIYKFLAMVNFSAFGYDQYYIGIKFQNIDSKKRKKIINELIDHDYIFTIFKTSGRFDVYVAFVSKDTQHYAEILRQINSICEEHILSTEIIEWVKDYKYSHIIKGIKLGTLFNYKRRDASFSKELFIRGEEFRRKKIDIDKTDLRILKELSKDPRIELKKLGKKVDLTGEAVRKRVSNLIKKEILLGFVAVPDYFNLDYQSYVLMIKTKNLDKGSDKDIQDFLQKKEYSVLSLRVVGKYDIMITVSVKDHKEFDIILNELRDEFSDVIKYIESLIFLGLYKYTLFPKGLE